MGKIGEAAFREGQEKIARKTRKSVANEDSSDEEGVEEDLGTHEPENELSQPAASQAKRGKGKANGRTRGKKRVADQDDDDDMEVDAAGQSDEENEEIPTRTQPKRKGRR